MNTDTQDKGHKLPEALLTLGVVALFAYAVMYLLAASPLLIRALGPLFAS
jgi:hypothetical protein